MKMQNALTILFCSVVTFSFSANVSAEEEKKEAGSGPNPYTECGIGASLFPNTHWAAVTSNVIWDLGLTALTSATASPETCNGKKATVAAFIYKTYDNLVEETAAGNGEHIATLFNILEVEDDTQSQMVSHIRNGMAEHLASNQYDYKDQVAKSSLYYNLVIEAFDKYSA